MQRTRWGGMGGCGGVSEGRGEDGNGVVVADRVVAERREGRWGDGDTVCTHRC